jgi:hypothetical protein
MDYFSIHKDRYGSIFREKTARASDRLRAPTHPPLATRTARRMRTMRSGAPLFSIEIERSKEYDGPVLSVRRRVDGARDDQGWTAQPCNGCLSSGSAGSRDDDVHGKKALPLSTIFAYLRPWAWISRDAGIRRAAVFRFF